MRNTWKIARWEILRNLTNKQFLIGLLITPLIMGLFIVVPALLERLNQPVATTYYLVDDLGVKDTLQALLPENIILEQAESGADLERLVQDTKASGYFVLTSDFITSGQVDLVYSDRNSQSMNAVSRGLTALLQQLRLNLSGVSPQELAFVTAPAQVRQVPLKEELEPQVMHLAVAGVFTMLIFFLIFTSGTMLMQSALQEKRDRMAEVVLSSVTPNALMQGKILGHFLLGLIQLGFWLALGLPIAIAFLDFPILEALKAVNLPVILLFGLGGYLLFSALFVGLGATMEDLQSAGNAQGLVIMLPMLAFLFLGPVMTNPDGSIAVFASIFPFTSSVIMMLRSGLGAVPLWQMLLSAGLLLITAFITMRISAKIFRVGMLMYGKNATPKEIMRWLRYKEN
ncbi:MAG TPA: ABC transporter permease [Limnochordia bacterium]|nr:ABC transporter permease [Limnochordia bacterium]